jgi:hypothetical protein
VRVLQYEFNDGLQIVVSNVRFPPEPDHMLLKTLTMASGSESLFLSTNR